MTNLISQQLVEKTMKELEETKNPQSHSRSWKDPEGYKFFIRRFTESLPKSEYRRKSQVDDAARSVVRNIEEGYKRTTTSEYLQFIGYSQGSLEEVKGDVRELTEDKFLQSKPGSNLIKIGINLGEFNQSLRVKGSYRKLEDAKGPLTSLNSPLTSFNSSSPSRPLRDFTYRPLTLLYPPLNNVKIANLTYEIFIELINKTDWLLRKLVESLEKKVSDNKSKYFR